MKNHSASIQNWIANGISKEPFLLHGTSVETIISLLNFGILPAKKSNNFYFTPISKNYMEFSHAIPINEDYSKKNAISTSEFYARDNAMEQYLNHKLGFAPSWLWDMAERTTQQFLYFLQDDKRTKCLSETQLKVVAQEVTQRKGIIVEPNENIFRLPYGDRDAEDCVTFYAPNGLPAEYIKGIKILGDVENAKIQRYTKKIN